MKQLRKQEGFTLVELMVVVLIIGILVAIAIPVFNAAKANAQTKSCFANQRTIEGAARSYEAEKGTFPADVATIKSGGYLAKEPACPADPTKGYTLDAAAGVVNACATHGYYGDK